MKKVTIGMLVSLLFCTSAFAHPSYWHGHGGWHHGWHGGHWHGGHGWHHGGHWGLGAGALGLGLLGGALVYPEGAYEHIGCPYGTYLAADGRCYGE